MGPKKAARKKRRAGKRPPPKTPDPVLSSSDEEGACHMAPAGLARWPSLEGAQTPREPARGMAGATRTAKMAKLWSDISARIQALEENAGGELPGTSGTARPRVQVMAAPTPVPAMSSREWDGELGEEQEQNAGPEAARNGPSGGWLGQPLHRGRGPWGGSRPPPQYPSEEVPGWGNQGCGPWGGSRPPPQYPSEEVPGWGNQGPSAALGNRAVLPAHGAGSGHHGEAGFPLGFHLLPATKEKILRGEFVDLFSLLFREPENSNEVDRNWENWLAGYIIYTGVVIQAHPWKAPAMLKYLDIIYRASLDYLEPAWLRYDKQFRMLAASYPAVPWHAPHQDLWLECFTPATRATGDRASSGHLLTQNVTGQGRPEPAGLWVQSRLLCCFFNSPGGCTRTPCRFQHKCSVCGGEHPCVSCPRNGMRRRRVRGGPIKAEK